MRLVVGRPNLPDFDDFVERARQIWDTGRLTNNGPMVRELENKIAEKLQVANVICVANATLGLEVVARALELTGEVIMPSWTFVATAHAMSWIGLKPVFVDVKGHHLDPGLVEKAITPETSAILHVHVWGQPGPLEDLYWIAAKHKLNFICDAAHAFGCSRDGQPLGDSGDAEVFSFHATKFFGTFEGGAITTNDDRLAQRCRQMRNFGFWDYDMVGTLGTNAKMSEIHAAFGLSLWKQVGSLASANRANFILYMQRLGNIMVRYSGEHQNYQYIVIEVDNRDKAMDALYNVGIHARRYFYPGVHRMFPYGDTRLSLPNTERLAQRTLCLPTGPSVTPEDITQICDIVEKACKL